MNYSVIKGHFTYHSLDEDQIERCQQVRRSAESLAHIINALGPDSSEKCKALTCLQEAVMWANAGIARNE